MSVSSDISNLFSLFGGDADWYQDHSPRAPQIQAHWPDHPAAVTPEPAQREASTAAEQVQRISEDLPKWSAQELQAQLAKLAKPSGAEPAPEAPFKPADLRHIRVIAVVSAKGGVGKSTLAANLAVTFSKAGSAVLAVDLDPQNALRQHFRTAPEQVCPAEAGLAHGATDLSSQCLRSEAGVLVLPYGQVDEPRRCAFEAQLSQEPDWLAQQLANWSLVKGTVVLIDTPPGPSVYLQQALTVANLALVVSLADAASYTALPMIERLIEHYSQNKADFFGNCYLINQVDHSRQLSLDITEIMRGLLGARLAGVIHSDPAIAEALAYNRNVLEYAAEGGASQDIVHCAQTLVERLALHAHGEKK